jgi:AcrR family transcriptional regulator
VNPAPPKRRRVRALPPEDRRAALIAVTIPLLREHGLAVSTRQIAEAAGVAEGTIFNVFPDKRSLLSAAVRAAFDPEPLQRAFDAIPRVELPDDVPDAWRKADLRRRLIAAVEILDVRVAENELLLPVIRAAANLTDLRGAREGLVHAISTVIEPDADLLRRSTMAAAWLIMSMLFINRQHFGPSPPQERLDPPEFVSLLLDGLFAPVQGETLC